MQGHKSYAWLLLLPATIVAVLCAALPALPLPLRVAGAAPLVLFLPGYWLLAAVAPDLLREPLERAVLSAGISLGICILVGVFLNLTPSGLTADAWVLALGGIALVGSAAAWLRGPRRESAPWPGVRGAPGRRESALFALAGLVLIGAFGLAHFTAGQQTAPDFTQLWITPAAIGGSVQLGVRNLEPTTMTYIIELRANGELVQRWPSLTLQPKQSWQTDLTEPDGSPLRGSLEALLYRADDPGQVYRRVLLRGS
jgi:uncharacterized membrane protein